MWQTLKMFLIVERSNRSNVFALIAVAACIIGFMFYASSEKVSNPLVETTAEYQSASSALSKFQVVDVNDEGDGSNLFGNITKQRQAIALKLAALNMDKEEMFYIASAKVLDRREKIYVMDGFDKVDELIPSKIHNDQERLFITTLSEEGVHYKQEPLAYYPFLLTLFSFIGAAWFVFLSIYTSGIMIEDFRHTSILKGYPVRFDKYVLAKSMTKFVMVLGFIGLIFIVSLPLIKIKGLGDGAYPVIVYNGGIVAYSIVKYLALCIVFMIVITIFTLLFSIILNMFLKNVYLTMFVQLILYFLPVLFPQLISMLPYNPFNFLNFNMIIEGDQLELASPVDITFKTGLIILVISIAVMLLAIKSFLTSGKLKRV